jgi:hypothetical protein
MAYLGVAPKNKGSLGQHVLQKEPSVMQDSTSDEAKRLAAAALSEVKDAAAAAASRGKVEVSISFANTLLIGFFWCSCSIVSYWLHSLALVYVDNIKVNFCPVV